MFYVFCAEISPRDLIFHPINSHDSVVQLLLEQSKWLVVTVFSAIILWRHDAKAMWAALGSAVNSILSVILKRILNQERPDSASRSDPGMPSSHGQSIFFTVVLSILSGNATLYLTCLLFISQLGILGQQLQNPSKEASWDFW